MKIGRTTNWYRPYAITVNNKGYKIHQIHFYNAEGIVVSSNSGWLETREGDIKEVELPIEKLKLKRKVKFDGTVFAIAAFEIANLAILQQPNALSKLFDEIAVVGHK